jgi:hypothetical protein
MAKATKTRKTAPKADNAKARRATARNAKREAANSTRKAKVVKASKVPTVPGYPSIEQCIGKGTGPKTIAGVVSINRQQDDAAVCNDGSLHKCTEHHRAGIRVLRGMEWDTVNRQYLKLLEGEAAAAKHPAVLAKGVEGKFTEHSRKAHQDAKAKKSAPAKAAKASKADAKAARKAERAAKAAPKADDSRKLTVVDKKFTFGAEGTARRASWDAAVKTAKAKGTAADYIKAGGKAKYLPRWVSAGAIKLG